MKEKTQKNDEIIIDLLQKLLIVELAKVGATRDEIKDIIKLGSEKIATVYKFFSKKGVKKNG